MSGGQFVGCNIFTSVNHCFLEEQPAQEHVKKNKKVMQLRRIVEWRIISFLF